MPILLHANTVATGLDFTFASNIKHLQTSSNHVPSSCPVHRKHGAMGPNQLQDPVARCASFRRRFCCVIHRNLCAGHFAGEHGHGCNKMSN